MYQNNSRPVGAVVALEWSALVILGGLLFVVNVNVLGKDCKYKEICWSKYLLLMA